MASSPIRETDLYPPIKQMLEQQGYEVKSEIGSADVVACRGEDDPVIVELKTGFSLSLFHQAIARQAITDTVYVAVPEGKGAQYAKSLKNNYNLCRRLGVGLITVKLKTGSVEIHNDPAEYKPRKSKPRKTRLLKEFAKRVGDPNTGGSTRKGLMTAYRQDALRCLSALHKNGPTKASLIAKETGVEKARRLMADDHYGWFERTQPGIYTITPKGEHALSDYAEALKTLKPRQAQDAS